MADIPSLSGYPRNFQFNYPGSYSPGRFMPAASPELGQLISMFAGPTLERMAGPGSFIPEMSQTQMRVDQFAMRNYQRQTLGSIQEMQNDGQANVASLLLGGRSMVTDSAPTELNKEQAMNMAGMINSPYVKPFLGAILGPERLEAIMHGSKGDVHALSNTLNKINYFRDDPSGGGRMNADSLTAFNRGVYSHLYEPQGNIQRLEQHARSSDAATASAGVEQLKKAARAPQLDVVSDNDVVTRLQGMKDAPEKVGELYKKYVAGGTATTTQQQAQELSRFQDAIRSAGVLKETETTVGGLVERANKAAVSDMHGFMAGQVGQISENMFQRGMMPKAVGKMSAADRARLIGATELDDETEIRLSHEMARKDFEDTKNTSDQAREFRGLTTEKERREFVERNADPYRTQLQDTRETIRQAAKGPMTPESASDLEKLQGFDALSSNVDAKRSADAIKKYTGAVSAVKDIFGDNGNTNAPLPALLAALEGLTGGAIGSMKPEKIQATLRQMQTLAKEAGVGFEQMAAMSAQIDSTGQMLGLTPADTMRIKGGSLAAVKVMQDTGAFSNPLYGQVDKGTATQQVGQLITQGAASRNAKSMAALAHIYDANPDRFKGTELESAVKAYRDNEGDGTYTYEKDGKKYTKNLIEDIGKRGEEGALRIARSSGVTAREYTAQRDNPMTNEGANHLFVFRTQKSDEIHTVNLGATSAYLAEDLSGTSFMQNKSHDQKSSIATKLGEEYTKLVFDTSTEDTPTQVKKIQEGLEARFLKVFEAEHPGDPATARARAKEAAAAASDPSKITATVGAINTQFQAETGRTLRNDMQLRGQDRDGLLAAEYSQAEQRAQRRMESGLGHESDFVAKSSDYFRKLGETGQNFDMGDYMRHVSEATTDREVLGAYANDMEPAFKKLAQMRKENFVTNSDIAALSDTQLKDSARLKKDVTIVSNEDAKKARENRVSEMGAATPEAKAAVAAAYSAHVKGAGKIDPTKMTNERQAELLKELRANPQFLLAAEKEALGVTKISRAGAEEKAAKIHVDEAKAGREDRAADYRAIERGMFEGHNPELVTAGVHAALRYSGTSLDDKQTEQLVAAVKDTSTEGREKLNTLIGTLPISKAAADEFFKPMQRGAEAQIHKTLGVSRLTDRELTAELTARATAQDMATEDAQKYAKDLTAEVAKKREDAKKAGKAPTTAAAAQQQERQHLEEALAQDKITRLKMSPEEAKKKAHDEAEAITQSKAADAAKTAGDAKQRADKLEVTAQTVIIKGERFAGEGGGEKSGIGDLLAGLIEKISGAGGKAAAGSATPVVNAAMSTAGGDGASLMDAAVTALGGSVETLASAGAGLDVLGKITSGDVLGGGIAAAQKLGFLGLSGKSPPETKPGQEKPDAPLAPQPAAPQPTPAEPEKVQQANGAQLKHDTGNATTGPSEDSAAARAKEVARLKQKQRDIGATATKNEIHIGRQELGYEAIAKKLAQEKAAGNEDNVEELQEKLENQKGVIVAQRAAERMGLSLDDGITQIYGEINGRLTGDSYRAGDKTIDPRVFDEEMENFDKDVAAGRDPSRNLTKIRQIRKIGEQIEAVQNGKPIPESGADDAAQKPPQKEKRYTANEWRKLHAGKREENAYGDKVPLTPISPGLPSGNLTRTRGGNYVNNATGEEFDRYGNPAGGTYSADGTSWEAGGAVALPADSAAAETPSSTAPPSQSAVIDPSKANSAEQAVLQGATATYEQHAPDAVKTTNEAQYTLQEVYARGQMRLADPTVSEEHREEAQRRIDNSMQLMAQHAAAKEAGINTDKGVDYDPHLGSINGTPIGKGSVARHLKALKEAAEKDPYAAVSDDVKQKLKIGKYSESNAVSAANNQQLQTAAGVQPAELKQETPGAAAAAPAPPSAGVSSSNVSPTAAAQAPVSAAVASAPLTAAIPETAMTRPEAEPLSRVMSMAADTQYGPAPGANAGGTAPGGGSMTINGTLTLSGLQEAILSAQGSQVLQTDGGAPVVVDPSIRAKTPAPSRTA